MTLINLYSEDERCGTDIGDHKVAGFIFDRDFHEFDRRDPLGYFEGLTAEDFRRNDDMDIKM